MALSMAGRKRIRKSFERLSGVAPMPNLIELQKNSYEAFLQRNIPFEKRQMLGLQAVFHSVFPVKDFSDKAQLEFYHYDFDEPKYDVEECRQRGTTYAAPLKVVFRLVVWDVDEDTGARSIRDIKEQEVYMGDIPLMTDNGTFIINGVERVIVSQMHRSPGVFFDHDRGKTHASGKLLFSGRVIPYRGSWLDFEFDAKDLLYVRIDRRRKLHATSLLMALDNEETAKKRQKAEQEGKELAPSEVVGLSREEILKLFYETIVFTHHDKGWKIPFEPTRWKSGKLVHDLIDAKTDKVVLAAGEKMTPRLAKKFKEDGLNEILVPADDLIGRYTAEDMINEDTGEIFVEAGEELTVQLIESLSSSGFKSIATLAIDHIHIGPYLRNTLAADRNYSREEALLDIYRVMRPGEPPTLESAEALFSGLFFDFERFDLSAVGRVKMNARLGLETEDTARTLRKDDIISIVKILLELKDGRGEIDDIDNLGNRRVRPVGELLENQYRTGLSRMERAIRERMSSVEIDTVMPHDLINAKPVSGAVKEFFASSQLSQFMDQVNPLAEITHKRRLSALGPGGLTRDRAGFEVRDVHPTHYGRICPIETPEGPNIGLINSLATFARVNKYGFIESPYRRVVDGFVSDEIVYLSATEEGRYAIAQASAAMDNKGKLLEDFVSCRKGGDFTIAPPSDIQFIDVSPKQLVSVAASLIPFLENDDANRALMGSNMQRQAVPLMRAETPLVGTGMEKSVARDSGVTVVAKRDGIVDQVDATRIVVRVKETSASTPSVVDIYNLQKFQRSNQNTCINQRPLVRPGEFVKAGDIIADGPATDAGELALGRNVLVGFMSWNGYNFEDSIILSERLVREDVFTSIHIEEFEVHARDTKLGQEEITRDIPNVGDEALCHLDEAGIVSIGAEVKPGDILVGKVTPKGETPVTPEEKLLRAIFGEKASDVRDTSLRVQPGVSGTVVEVRVFSRRGVEKDERALAIERAEINRLAADRDTEKGILERAFFARLKQLLLDQKVVGAPRGAKTNVTVDEAYLATLTTGQWRQLVVENDVIMTEIEAMRKQHDEDVSVIQKRFEDKVEKVRRGDELPTGVLKTVKVFIATKRKIQAGDKMAGRHGNKGVVSVIVPEEDMPHLEDGTPVDIVLNPLGVPSRMNVGQILETHLGWAAAGLGKQISHMLGDIYSENKNPEDLKKLMTGIYQKETDIQKIEKMDDAELIETAASMIRGVPMATPVFDGAHEDDIIRELQRANLNTSGQVTLIDGRTGEPFERSVTVGYIYMLKLSHMVDDKIHARSVGPYSLVTQQPLGGKAQFGGQRFGEMEVWALEAYGAAYTLQEMLTVKSDDVSGRTKVYEAIVRGEDAFESGIPESFNVLVKELRSLSLNLEFGE
ncbi:MAG: DNA-directed RNA polymerase subunit beta [Candidatus Paracaedimonas acanthamoebae]|uniref:DNA-directed RNA polymerase subunit beta n=1 Tax=Candidatus Paracaedimonas acanthamoebae TaxID=244581 RepID=A0A8J7TW59_9PROT|nr:DNA-directed RNA polymerase subunit beta [Candidatus Paracaedimonas acanthamoebae]